MTSGNSHSTYGRWTDYSTSACSGSFRIYCFGVDRVAPIKPLPAISGRKAFVTASSFNP